MYILQKINKYILLLLFLNACGVIFPIEPVLPINERFIARYRYSVNKAKEKHYKALQLAKENMDIEFANTAYGKFLRREYEFLETNEKNNPYIVMPRAGDKNLSYLAYNSDPYNAGEENLFDLIIIPSNDFKHYDLGRKKYNEISNIELQEAYDYMYIINRERLRQIEIARLRQEAIQKEIDKNSSLLDKGKKGLKNFTDKLKSLLK